MKKLIVALAACIIPAFSFAQIEEKKMTVYCMSLDSAKQIVDKFQETPLIVMNNSEKQLSSVIMANKKTGSWTYFIFVADSV